MMRHAWLVCDLCLGWNEFEAGLERRLCFSVRLQPYGGLVVDSHRHVQHGPSTRSLRGQSGMVSDNFDMSQTNGDVSVFETNVRLCGWAADRLRLTGRRSSSKGRRTLWTSCACI